MDANYIAGGGCYWQQARARCLSQGWSDMYVAALAFVITVSLRAMVAVMHGRRSFERARNSIGWMAHLLVVNTDWPRAALPSKGGQ